MSLLDYGQWLTLPRAANVFRSGFCAAVVHEDDFKIRCVRLPRQGLQAFLNRFPIVVNRDDDAESRCHGRVSLALSHGSLDCRSVGAPSAMNLGFHTRSLNQNFNMGTLVMMRRLVSPFRSRFRPFLVGSRSSAQVCFQSSLLTSQHRAVV